MTCYVSHPLGARDGAWSLEHGLWDDGGVRLIDSLIDCRVSGWNLAKQEIRKQFWRVNRETQEGESTTNTTVKRTKATLPACQVLLAAIWRIHYLHFYQRHPPVRSLDGPKRSCQKLESGRYARKVPPTDHGSRPTAGRSHSHCSRNTIWAGCHEAEFHVDVRSTGVSTYVHTE